MRRAAPLALLALCAPGLARAQAGRWAVQGQDPVLGDFTGEVELRPGAAGYELIRVVQAGTLRHAGRRVSGVWTGTARDAAGGVDVALQLERTGWAGAGAGVVRGPADGVPAQVVGTFRAGANGALAGAWSGPGVALPTRELWTFVGPAGAAPLWRSQRRREPLHGPPPPLLRAVLFGLFASFHRTPWVQPWVSRPELQAAVHWAVHDPTDFELLRREPDLLRVVQRVVDPLTLEEARLRSLAFGQTLRAKAALADAEAPAFLDPSGALALRDAAGRLVAEGDAGLWTGVYALTQALRWRATQEPVARANLERALAAWVTQVDIDLDPATFARTIRAASGVPRPPDWHAGQGRFQGLEWLQGGNNDMFKGLLLAGLAGHEGLPAGHPLRGELLRVLRELGHASPLTRSPSSANGLLTWGTAALLGGDPADAARYRRLARNPFRLLSGLTGGGFFWQGISDWSGNHLGVCTLLLRIRVAQHLGERVEGTVARLVLRLSEARLRPSRPTLHTLLAAGSARLPLLPPVDPSDAVWSLREAPYPRSTLRAGHGLRGEFCLSPWPALPWKRDWTTNPGRQQGLEIPPRFETSPGVYRWKDDPLVAQEHGGGPLRHAAADDLFAYWLARDQGVIGPAD